MPIYEALASWWVGAAVMASFVMLTPEGVSFNLSTYRPITVSPALSCSVWVLYETI